MKATYLELCIMIFILCGLSWDWTKGIILILSFIEFSLLLIHYLNRYIRGEKHE